MSESSVLSPCLHPAGIQLLFLKGVEKQIQGRESPKKSFEKKKTLGLEREKNHCVNEAD